MPAPTYIAISNTVLGSNTTSFTINSIPQTYTDLVLVARWASTSNSRGMLMRFNSDSGSNYSVAGLVGYGASGTNAIPANEINRTWVRLGAWNDGAGTSFDSPGFTITHINNYTSTTQNKTVLSQYMCQPDGANRNDVGYLVNEWRNTNAITSITIFDPSGPSYITGTRVTLYGIKAE